MKTVKPNTKAFEVCSKIARDHLFIATLWPQGRDFLDFHEVGVVSVAAALKAAYDAGFEAGVKAAAQ